MTKYNKIPNFNITVNYPTPENQKKFENRAAKAVAKVLIDTLDSETIDKLIEALDKENN